VTRYLFTTLPTDDLGLLARSLPIAQALTKSGHSICFCSPARAPSRLIADAGFENVLPRHPLFDLLATDPSLRGLVSLLTSGRWKQRHRSLFRFLRELIPALPLKSAPRSADVWNMDQAGALMGMLNEGFVRANVQSLRDLMVTTASDVVVDFWNPFAVIAARAEKRPLVTVIQSDAHPGSQGFIWWKQAPPNLSSPVPVVNRVLSGLGLPSVRRLEELCVGDLTLVVGTPETDPLPIGSDVIYIGAALWQKHDATLPDWIMSRDRRRPLIWVYSGNPRYASGGQTLDSAVVLQASIAALRHEDVQVVLTTGHHAMLEEMLPLPAHFCHEAYLPGLAMAEQADLLIHHGGYGSCQTGLYMGTPAVIIPTFSERESNARRVASLGAGVIVPVKLVKGVKHVDVTVLRDAVREVLGSPRYAEGARRAGSQLRKYGGAEAAARLIEDFSSKLCSPS
jgi:UDP:flavonoid glycosyltransferase YjiC (YdhE family)